MGGVRVWSRTSDEMQGFVGFWNNDRVVISPGKVAGNYAVSVSSRLYPLVNGLQKQLHWRNRLKRFFLSCIAKTASSFEKEPLQMVSSQVCQNKHVYHWHCQIQLQLLAPPSLFLHWAALLCACMRTHTVVLLCSRLPQQVTTNHSLTQLERVLHRNLTRRSFR